jgi:triosephosphate isomerase
MRPLIAGNWKMNGVKAALAQVSDVARGIADEPPPADVLICPPFTLVSGAVATAAGRIAIGGQDCHALPSGAFTGDVSAEMLADAGASAVIVGHSERRQQHGETDAMVAAKVGAAWRAGLLPILCVGETALEHNGGRAGDVVQGQLGASLPPDATARTIVIAYEPIWAIGSGRTPKPEEIARMHAGIRAQLETSLGGEGSDVRVLYGGSVGPANAAAILALPNVNGVLVGGASLVAQDFLAIVRSVSTGR